MTAETTPALACDVCEYARKHGWCGPNHRGAHCYRCHRSWTAKAHVHCTVCCEQFASYGIANYHWGNGKSNRAPAYEAKHLDPREVPALVRDADGVWHRDGVRPVDLHGACPEALKVIPGPHVPAGAESQPQDAA